jgi:hypothetical protein
MMGKRKIYILKLSHAHFTLHYAQVTPSEQGIPEIITLGGNSSLLGCSPNLWNSSLLKCSLNQPLELLTPGVFLGNSALLRYSPTQNQGSQTKVVI